MLKMKVFVSAHEKLTYFLETNVFNAKLSNLEQIT